ncbi:MAG: hypothetical protein K2W95_28060 [Candidatus Obscuribacterales bacterium]|nr:hypothetical protein [Candidatus Obscuribacterales bacterium]
MTDQSAPGSILDARYEILHHVGSVGMGSVYKARERELNRTVGIKILHDVYPDKSEDCRRFKREGQVLAKLLHPNIVVVYRLGSNDGNLYVDVSRGVEEAF